MQQQLQNAAPSVDPPPLKLKFATVALENLDAWLPKLFNQWTQPRRLATGCIQQSSSPQTLLDGPTIATNNQGNNLPRSRRQLSEDLQIRSDQDLGESCSTVGRYDAEVTWNFFRPTGIVAPMIWVGTFEASGDLQIYGSDVFSAAPNVIDTVIVAQLLEIPINEEVQLKIASSLMEFQAAGAKAALLVAPRGGVPFTLRCDKCDSGSVGMPITMVSYEAGAPWVDALKEGSGVTANFTEEQGPGLSVGKFLYFLIYY